MNHLMSACRVWLKLLQNNRSVTIILTGITTLILAIAWQQFKMIHALGYLAAMLLVALIVEIVYQRYPLATTSWLIQNNKQEISILIMVIAMQWIATLGRFVWVADWNHAETPIRLTLFIMMILFIYPVFLLIYYFAIARYKPVQLGLSINKSMWISLPVIAVIAAFSFLVAPESIRFATLYESHGLLQLILLGFLTAALPEEFIRLLLQTRLAKVFRNNAWSWLITGLLWAAIHIPNFHQTSNWQNATVTALAILPIGLLWGYSTHRFKSIWPSVIIHGTNLWGLHSLF